MPLFPKVRIVFSRYVWLGFSIVRKKRKARRYFYNSDFIIDSGHSTSDPPFRTWALTILSLLTAANTTDLALSGLSAAFSLPFAINLAFIGINIVLGLYYLKNLLVDLFTNPRELLKNFLKLALTTGVCYALVHAGMLTLASVAPGINVVLGVIFLINAAAIGINLATACANIFFPYIQRLCRSWWAKFKKKSLGPMRLSKQVTKKHSQNAAYIVPLSGDVLKEFRERGFDEGSQDVPETDSALGLRMRHVLANYFHSEEKRLLARKPGAVLARASRIQNCANNFDLVVKQGNLAADSAPVLGYFSRVTGLIKKIAYDIVRADIISKAVENYKNASSTEQKIDTAIEAIRIIAGKNTYYSEANIQIDYLRTALKQIERGMRNKKSGPPLNNENDIVRILKRYVFFETVGNDLGSLLDELKTLATGKIEQRYLPKLLKLHDLCCLSVDKINALITKRIQGIVNEKNEISTILEIAEKNTGKTNAEEQALSESCNLYRDLLHNPQFTEKNLIDLKQKRYNYLGAIKPIDRLKTLINRLQTRLAQRENENACPVHSGGHSHCLNFNDK